MARISVYIPDERMPEIEQWRDTMNFSQLFIEAFDRAVQSQTELSKLKDSEMKAVVQRLKEASERAFESGWKEGVALGTEWAAKHCHFSHLRRIGEGKLAFDLDGDDVVHWLCYLYEHQGYCKTPADEQKEMELERFSDTETYVRGRNAGFVDAAKNIWDEVRVAFPQRE